MKKRLVYGFLLTLLALCVLFVVWEGSFNPGRFHPDNPGQTLIFWAVSSLTFLLMVILGWILFREFVKLYVETRSEQERRMAEQAPPPPGNEMKAETNPQRELLAAQPEVRQLFLTGARTP